MKTEYKPKSFLVLAVVFIVVAVMSDVSAQNTQTNAPPQIDLTINTESNDLTGAQQITWISEQSQKCKEIYRRVQNMLDRARKEKDPIMITCLDDKLTQVHVNLRGIEERKSALEIAVDSGDQSTAKQQFTILQIYVQRVHGLIAEADSCIGDSDVVIGDSETIVTIDENITVEDPTAPIDVQVGFDQPPHASGYY